MIVITRVKENLEKQPVIFYIISDEFLTVKFEANLRLIRVQGETN